jgi:hypothetical protein
MRRRTGWVAGLVPLLVVAATPARAQPATGEAPGTAAGLAQLIVVGGGRETAALLDTVRDRLDRVGLVVEVHAVATPAEAAALPRGSTAARVQVDLRAPEDVVMITEGRRQAPKQRTLRRDPSPTVAREELAEAIESALESQLFADPERRNGDGEGPAGRNAGTPDASGAAAAADSAAGGAPTPAPPLVVPAIAPTREAPATSGTSSSSLSVDVSTLAGGGWFAGAVGPVVALGGNVTLASRTGWRPSLSLSARSILPFEGTADSVTCHASAFAVRALAGIELAHASWIALVAGAGGGADILWADPRSVVFAPSVLGPSTTRADPILSAYVGAHLALVPGVTMTVMVLGDLDLAPSRYVIVDGASVEPVLAPWSVRPTLLGGFTFTAFGQAAFASWSGR